ncbi:MAG: hypothetical protein Q9160_005139 [Pyrenula sp. 1 TL-2023]
MPHSEHSSLDSPRISTTELPYWLVNVPENEWPDDPNTCPDFLIDLSCKNIATLLTRDETFHLSSWEEVKNIIEIGHVDLFQRIPSELRRYFQFVHRLKIDYGSIFEFMVAERLKWTQWTPKSSIPFKDLADYKILYNDWPYGIDKDIVHLVVWTKFNIPEDPRTGQVEDSERARIDYFVYHTFCEPVEFSQENVRWFKNPSRLKSVHSIEHFHVMLYKPDEKLIRTVTNGDVPFSKRPKVEQALPWKT